MKDYNVMNDGKKRFWSASEKGYENIKGSVYYNWSSRWLHNWLIAGKKT